MSPEDEVTLLWVLMAGFVVSILLILFIEFWKSHKRKLALVNVLTPEETYDKTRITP